MWYTYLMLFLALVSGVLQLVGLRSIPKYCVPIKVGYAITLFASAIIIFTMEVTNEQEYGFALALGILLVNMLFGSVCRLFTKSSLSKKLKECSRCGH